MLPIVFRGTIIALGLMLATAPRAGTVKPVSRTDVVVVYKTESTFNDVLEAVKLAISQQGLVVNNISHISNMLQRTGQDAGKQARIYGKGEAVEFCSATLSRKIMEADPNNIVFCPFIVAVYTLPDNPKTVYLAYRRPTLVGNEASRKSLKEVEALIDRIAQDALAW